MTTQRQDKQWREHIEEHSPRVVPVIRGKGMSGLWGRQAADYGGFLTEEELDVALSYYGQFPEDIGRKLGELEH